MHSFFALKKMSDTTCVLLFDKGFISFEQLENVKQHCYQERDAKKFVQIVAQHCTIERLKEELLELKSKNIVVFYAGLMITGLTRFGRSEPLSLDTILSEIQQETVVFHISEALKEKLGERKNVFYYAQC